MTADAVRIAIVCSVVGVAVPGCGGNEPERVLTPVEVERAFKDRGVVVLRRDLPFKADLLSNMSPQYDPNPNPQFEVTVWRSVNDASKHLAIDLSTDKTDCWRRANVIACYEKRTKPDRLEAVRSVMADLEDAANDG